MTTINTIEDLMRLLDENPQWVEALRARLLTRDLIELPEKFATFATEASQRFERIDQRLGRLENTVGRMQDDMGVLRGAHARNVAVENAALIARRAMGLRRVRNLTRDDLLDLTDAADLSALTPRELQSFHLADLVMEGTPNG